MKKKIIILLASAFVLFTAFTTAEWVTFTSNLGKFSILMPTQPKETRDTVKTGGPGTPYSTYLFISKDAATNDLYLIGWVDYEPNYNYNVESEIDANRDNFIKGVEGTLIESKPISWNGSKGVHFTAKSEGNGYLWTSKVIVIGRRPYQLVLGSPGGQPSANEEKFFNSFKITK